MKRNHSIALLFLVISVALIITACRAGEQSTYGTPSGTASAASSNPDELTMSVVLYSDKHLKDAVKLYEEKTGVKVNIQNNFIHPDWDTTAYYLYPYPDTSKYAEQALAALMTGSGADIYDVSWLEFEQLGKNGLLVDMGNWLENDAELTNDIVFRDILLSEKTANGVFAVPLDFYLRKLGAFSGANVPKLENKRMTWQEFFDTVSGLELSQELAYFDLELNIFMERFISRASDFIDEAGNTQNLNSKDMIALLEECRDWRDEGLCGDSRYLSAFDNIWQTRSFSYMSTYLTHFGIAEKLCTLPEEYKPFVYYFFAPIPFDVGPLVIDGEARFPEININVLGQGLYGVNAGSPRADAAQNFLRFLLSEEGQEEMKNKDPGDFNGFYLPVNRAVFRSLIDQDLERVQASNRELKHDFPALRKEAEDTIDQIAYIIKEKPYYRTIIREVAKEFFLDQISAEEAARQMSDKVGLYLKEQGT